MYARMLKPCKNSWSKIIVITSVQYIPKKLYTTYVHKTFLHLANQIVYKVKNMRDISHMEMTTPQSSFQV